MTWKPATFMRALFVYGPIKCVGYTYRGLGLWLAMPASPKGRRPPTWFLIHLNSGHRVARIDGFVSDAFPIASEIAECADWDFNGLDGWRNQDPELPKKMSQIINRNAKRAKMRASGGSDADLASEISRARAMA